MLWLAGQSVTQSDFAKRLPDIEAHIAELSLQQNRASQQLRNMGQ